LVKPTTIVRIEKDKYLSNISETYSAYIAGLHLGITPQSLDCRVMVARTVRAETQAHPKTIVSNNKTTRCVRRGRERDVAMICHKVSHNVRQTPLPQTSAPHQVVRHDFNDASDQNAHGIRSGKSVAALESSRGGTNN
jgi:hypothetical protein